MGHIVWAVAVFLVLAAIYLFFAGSVDVVEAIAMAVCAAAGTALFVAVEIAAKLNLLPMPPPRAILHPIVSLLPETVIVGRELIATVLVGPKRRGALVDQPFVPGDEQPRAAARRALTVIGVSLAPRTFVVRGARTQRLLLHALPAKGAPADQKWPA